MTKTPFPAKNIQNAQTLEEILVTGTEEQLSALFGELMATGSLQNACRVVERIVAINPRNIEAKFAYAQLLSDGTHKGIALGRDIMLSILDEHRSIEDNPSPAGMRLMRQAAKKCSFVGPIDRSIELYRKVAAFSKDAKDYFALSEVLAQRSFLEESLTALQAAMKLDPEKYDTDANRETLALGLSSIDTQPTVQKAKMPKTKIWRYPLTEEFRGDFQSLVKNHIAANFLQAEKFIDKKTRFFTMGSCFARNISVALSKLGFTSDHMMLAEHINTTFANRVFVDWLENKSDNLAVNERIRELLPADWDSTKIVQTISRANVFILTLGVAPAFFDRATGQYVLPRPSTLNTRVLAEKYENRNTTVSQNVDNALYLINYMRKLSPNIKIIVTVSPVPIGASFGNSSCVQVDCLSKSTMRLVADEVVNHSNLSNIIYWPSFEIFRWGGSNASDYFAADDGASWHVSEAKVNGTIQAFLDLFSTGS